MSVQTFKIHTSISSAVAILAIGERVVSKKWKETKNQARNERAIIVAAETLLAPEVPEAFRALVESALTDTAESTLAKYCEENPNSYEVNAELFTRPQLVENFLQRGQAWMTKPALELAFTGSATWKRIAGNEKYSQGGAYTATANRLRDDILKLTGKNVTLADARMNDTEKCDWILSKLDESDLETEFGLFITRRLQQIGKRSEVEYDPDAL